MKKILEISNNKSNELYDLLCKQNWSITVDSKGRIILYSKENTVKELDDGVKHRMNMCPFITLESDDASDIYNYLETMCPLSMQDDSQPDFKDVEDAYDKLYNRVSNVLDSKAE